jgi:hypothetical protein
MCGTSSKGRPPSPIIVAIAIATAAVVCPFVCHPEGDLLLPLSIAVAIVLAVAVVLAVASKVERGFSPASKRPPQSGHRSAEGRSEGEAATTDLLPLPLQLHLGTPRLQPWVSQHMKERGALAPEVRPKKTPLDEYRKLRYKYRDLQ